MAWEEDPEGAPGQIRVSLNQVQDRLASNVDAFKVLLPVWFETADATYQVWLDVDEREEVFDVSIPAPVLAVHVDPERWVLRGETLTAGSTGVESLTGPQLSIQVAPHPAHGDLNVSIAKSQSGSGTAEIVVEVYDLTGRRVWQDIRSDGRDLRVSIPGLASGRYLLRVRQGSYVDEQLVVIRSR